MRQLKMRTKGLYTPLQSFTRLYFETRIENTLELRAVTQRQQIHKKMKEADK